MNSKICEILGIEFPLLAFSHCKDVVAQVSKAGGMGVLGAVGMTPEILEQELNWIDQHVDGKPYGLDLLVPNKFVGKEPIRLNKNAPIAFQKMPTVKNVELIALIKSILKVFGFVNDCTEFLFSKDFFSHF